MAQQGKPINAIQAQLRHGSLAVTDRYIRHLMPADVVATVRDLDWFEDS
jgi:integrase